MRKVLLLLIAPLLLVGSETASEILDKSLQLFSGESLRFVVRARNERANGVRERRFLVARRTVESEKDLLIRFLAPTTLRCTTILTLERRDRATTYVYFPAIGRIRRIPSGKEHKEAVGGLGISYAQLHGGGGELLPLETVEKDGIPYYKITRRAQNGDRTIYWIQKQERTLRRVVTKRDGRIVKEIVVDRIGEAGGVKMILAWHIVDRRRGRVLRFDIEPSSVRHDVSATLFKKSRLKRCSS